MAIFIKFGDLNGSATDSNHKNWCEADSITFNCARSVNTSFGQNTNRLNLKPNLRQVEIIKDSDNSSPQLFKSMLNGKVMDEVKIHVCHTGKSLEVNKEYTLHDVLISFYEDSVVGDSHSIGKECVRLDFTKIETRLTPYDEQGKAGSPISTGYDITTAQSL